jgi:hypothetical protein
MACRCVRSVMTLRQPAAFAASQARLHMSRIYSMKEYRGRRFCHVGGTGPLTKAKRKLLPTARRCNHRQYALEHIFEGRNLSAWIDDYPNRGESLRGIARSRSSYKVCLALSKFAELCDPSPDHAPHGAFLHVRPAHARHRSVLVDRCEATLGATRLRLICLLGGAPGPAAPRLMDRTA